VLVDGFHYLGLFAIGAATVWAAAATFVEIVHTKHHASVEDLLLHFIYLGIGAMVGIDFKTNHMPVRFLSYFANTAATGHMIAVVIGGALCVLQVPRRFVRQRASDLADADQASNQQAGGTP
jgi:phosphate starvation-inducible membrane PsiE